MNQRSLGRLVLALVLVLSALSFAQQPAAAPEAPKDIISRIFSGEFSERPTPAPHWFA